MGAATRPSSSRATSRAKAILTRPAWAGAALFALTLVFYLYTLQPSLAWGDGTRLQREAVTGESFILAEIVQPDYAPDPFPFARLGVAAWDHPLWVMLTHSAVRLLPFIHSLWLVNVVSALFGALTLTLIYALVWEHTRSMAAGLLAAAALGVAHTFWFHSVTPEVYTLWAVLLLGALWAYLRWRAGGGERWLRLGALLLGLAASTHLMSGLAAPIVLLDLAWANRGRLNWRDWRKAARPLLMAALFFTLGFAPYLIQFLRMLRTVPADQVIRLATGKDFFTGMRDNSFASFLRSAITFLVFCGLQFNPLGVGLAAAGLWRGARAAPALGRVTVLGFAGYGAFGVLYRVSDQFAFFLPAYLFLALALGLGLAGALARWPARRRRLIALTLAGIVLMPVLYAVAPQAARAAGLNDASAGIPQIGTGVRDGLAYYINPNKHGDDAPYRFGTETLAALPPNSLVLAEWYTDTDEYFVLRYFVAVEGRRPDVEVAGWPTEDPFAFDTALATGLVAESLPVRPVYLASLSDEFYAASALMEMYCVVPEHNLYRVIERDGQAQPCLAPE